MPHAQPPEELAGRLEREGCGDLVAVVGFLDRADGLEDRVGIPKNAPLNSVAVLHGGAIVARQAKHHLWNYGVGDEIRNFVPGDTINIIQVGGVDVAIAICEDLWRDGPSAAAKAADAALLVVPNGSPYEADKDDARLDLCTQRAREGECVLAYVNLVGGQDELVFDGDSIVVAPDGTVLGRSRQFVSELLVVDLDLPAATATMPDPAREVRGPGHQAHRHLCRSGAVVRASRGDGARAAPPVRGDVSRARRGAPRLRGQERLLQRPDGPVRRHRLHARRHDRRRRARRRERLRRLQPERLVERALTSDAAELAERTGLQLDTIPIAPIFDAYQQALKLDGLAEENLQARIRAVIWMGLSNQHGHLVLACGNKSELATGYSTIYGDAVGGYAPIKDVPKTLVWELARWRNAWAEQHGETPPIPENTISKPPSAELRPGQLDTDSLPPYDVLDAVLDAYVERDLGSADVIAEGFDPALVAKVVTLVDKAEYKRRQYPPGPKISRRNFGRDRRVPITNLWREDL